MIKIWREEIRSKLFNEPARWSVGVYEVSPPYGGDVKDKGVYTDGSKLGKQREGGAAALFCEDNIIFAISERLEGEGMTNNIAELKSIINSLIYFNEKSYPIFSDSEYAIKAITGVNKVVKNKELIEDGKLLYEWYGKPKINHVEAHKGVILNELADQLARDVINMK